MGNGVYMIPIKDIMTRQVITVKPDMRIFDAMALLTKHAISGMPVVGDDSSLKGMLTEKDVLEILIKKDFNAKDTVEDYMSRNVVSFGEGADAVDICKFFMKNTIRRVPIITEGKLVGIVSRRDIIKLILEYKSKLSLEHRYN